MHSQTLNVGGTDPPPNRQRVGLFGTESASLSEDEGGDEEATAVEPEARPEKNPRPAPPVPIRVAMDRRISESIMEEEKPTARPDPRLE